MRFLILFAIFVSSAVSADFTTYIGGANLSQSVSVAALATDPAGDTFVTGIQVTEPTGSSNVFVTKLDPAGAIVFTVTPGPDGSLANAIAVDPAGNIWLAGQTIATNFPLVNALQSTPGLAPGTGFLMKLAPDGTVLFSSYFGGALGSSTVNGLATDPSGNVYVAGSTRSSDFPTTAGLPASSVTIAVSGAFVTKLNATGQKIIYSTAIAGTAVNCSGTECTSVAPSTTGAGIAIDGSGNALVAGSTNTTDLPEPSGGVSGTGPFALKINAAGNQLVYLSFLGPPPGIVNDVSTSTSLAPARPIVADAPGNAYIAGYTNIPSFPATVGAYSGGANPQTFAIELNPAGVTVWGILTGSPAGSWPNALSLDSSGNVWLTGTNGSMSAPGESFVEQLTAATTIVGELTARDTAPPYSALFPPGGAGRDLVIDQSGIVHVAGSAGFISTITPANPAAPRVLSIVNAADGINVGQIAPGEVISIFGSGLGPTAAVSATPQNGFFPTSLGGVQVLVNGVAIPLVYVSASQINAEIPSPVLGIGNGGVQTGGVDGYMALVQVVYNSVTLPNFRVAVVGSDFAAFEKSGGSMAVINQDGTVNKEANPAKLGTVVSIWATGFGATGHSIDGQVSAGAGNYCSTCQVTLSDGSNSITETVQYAGAAPGLIDGLMQINFLIPEQLSNLVSGVWVYFTPPGYPRPLQLGFVQVSPTPVP